MRRRIAEKWWEALGAIGLPKSRWLALSRTTRSPAAASSAMPIMCGIE